MATVVIDRNVFTDLREYLEALPGDMQPSMLYRPADDKRVVDLTHRRSYFRDIRDDALFDKVDRVVDEAREQFPSMRLRLLRNNITDIEYRPGGYFGAHEDFQSLHSNGLIEYTMIIGVNTSEESARTVGGETVVYPEGDDTGVQYRTQDNVCIIFPKSLLHAGAPVVQGYKRVVTANLIGVKAKEDERILVVETPRGRIMALWESEASGYFKGLFNWDRVGRSDRDPGPALVYHRSDFEDMEAVLDLMRGRDPEVTEGALPALDFYLDIHECIWSMSMSKGWSDDRRILVISPERKSVASSLVLRMQLPYLPFRMVFIEGTYRAGHDYEPSGERDDNEGEYPFSPVLFTIGDDALVYHCDFASATNTRSDDIQKTIKASCVRESDKFEWQFDPDIASKNPWRWEDGHMEVCRWQNPMDVQQKEVVRGYFNWGLRARSVVTADITDFLNGRVMVSNRSREGNGCLFDVIPERAESAAVEGHYWTRDERGSVFFTADQARRSMQYLKNLDADAIVQREIVSRRPSETRGPPDRDVNVTYCNEHVYGKLTVLEIEGFIRFDE